MSPKQVALLGCAAVAGMLCACGKSEKTAATSDAESLNIETVRAMMPQDGTDDSTKLKQALLRNAIAHELLVTARQPDSVSVKLGRRMTLISGAEWPPKAASVLLMAGAGLEAKVKTAKDIKSVLALVDSLAAVSAKSAGGKTARCAALDPRDRAALEAMRLTDAKLLVKVFSVVFAISEEEASTLSSFVGTDARKSAGSADVLVKGLLATRSEGTTGPAAAVEAERTVIENPSLALKFRPQQSIRDSIGKHLADLQQLYKRQLKTNEASGGVVWVVFRVEAGGTVLSTAIKSSQIDNRQFLAGLRNYARTIRFKPIPDKVGPMTFEFPFEFKPEL
jgi:hypothetical protein